MSSDISLSLNQSSFDEVLAHLGTCDCAFVPPLSQRVTLAEYAQKLIDHAVRVEAWYGKDLVGLLALYESTDGEKSVYITNVSVMPAWHGQKIASSMIAKYHYIASEKGIKHMKLHVQHDNQPALHLYQQMGFVTEPGHSARMPMTLQLC